MLTFFRINALFQILILALFGLLLQSPWLSGREPILTSELEWLLIGEQLHQGKSLYRDVLTLVAPLSAYFYQFFYFLFGRNLFVLQGLAIGLGFLQSIYFVWLTQSRQTFAEKNYLVGFVYLILLHVCFDLTKLSPALLGMMWVLPAINQVLKQIESRSGVRDEIIEVGIFIGLAGLFYPPFWVLLAWVFISTILYSSVNPRQLLLMCIGFSLPLIALSLFFYFTNNKAFQSIWIANLIQWPIFSASEWTSQIRAWAIPVVLATLGLIKMLRATRYSNYQNRYHQAFLLYLVTSLLSLAFAPQQIPMYALGLVPALSLFISGWFIHLRGTWLPELYFTLFVGLVVMNYFLGSIGMGMAAVPEHSQLRLGESKLPTPFHHQRLLILGAEIAEYQEAQPATKYLNWALAKRDFQSIKKYESLVSIFDTFATSPPTIILDKENLMPLLMEKIPSIKSKYKALPAYPGYYQLQEPISKRSY